jgi:hypothetical protein
LGTDEIRNFSPEQIHIVRDSAVLQAALAKVPLQNEAYYRRKLEIEDNEANAALAAGGFVSAVAFATWKILRGQLGG